MSHRREAASGRGRFRPSRGTRASRPRRARRGRSNTRPASSTACTISPRPWFYSNADRLRELAGFAVGVGGSRILEARSRRPTRSTGTEPSRPIDLVGRPQHRMAFADVEPPARPQQRGDRLAAQRPMSGSQQSAPTPVYTRSKRSLAERRGRVRTARTRRTSTSTPACAARSRADRERATARSRGR